MMNIIRTLTNWLLTRAQHDERGEVSLEYVLVGGLAAVAIVAGMAVLSPAIVAWFTTIATTISNALERRE
jgi:Flp pilus assembly pilin Flp